MYVLEEWKKQDPVVRWGLPDRIFFGHGACHVLAGVFVCKRINPTFKAYWVKPHQHPGNHIYVSDGVVAFDYHGYSRLSHLHRHHWKCWQRQYPGWTADIVPVDFDLLDESALNARHMRGPDQYHGDALARANAYLNRIDHPAAELRARAL